MSILIKNGRIICPGQNIDKVMDIYVKNGVISELGKDISMEAETVIDASNMWVTPGLIDLHVHLRDPGLTHKEDMQSGSKAAAMGGFTTICAMPNTKPAMDTPELVRETGERMKKDSAIDILVIGAATTGQKGEVLADIEGMAKAGVCAISEDGFSVLDSKLVKEAFKKCAENNLPMFSHCEDLALVNGGVINEGVASEKFGLLGISNDSEDVIVARDIILAAATGAKLHLCHMSTRGSVDIIRGAKALGANVSAEVCPHHFTLCDEDIVENDGDYKMNPPLRSRADMNAIIEALKDNTIEIIATDHAPHHVDEKTGGFEKAANGIVGLETALALGITELVKKNILTPSEFIGKLTCNPAKVLGIKAGLLKVGYPADIAVIDAETEYAVNIDEFRSKGKNTPFNGKKVCGKAIYVVKNGNIVADNGKINEKPS